MSVDYWLEVYRNVINKYSPEEVENLWDGIEEVYQHDLDKASIERSEKREALGFLWSEYNWDVPKTASKDLAPLVRETVALMDEDFTVRDVQGRLHKDHPYIMSKIHPSSISGILGRMKNEGLVEELVKGSGPRPTRYSSVN